METPVIAAARELVRSMEEVGAVFEIQGRQADAARELANTTRTRFDALLQASASGEKAGESAPNPWEPLPPPNLEQTSASVRASCTLSLRWETAFCDAFAALMRLYAAPEVREEVEGIAEKIRALRLLQVTNPEADLPPVVLPSFPAGEPAAEETPAEPGGKMARFMQMMASMDAYKEETERVFSRKTEQTRSLLDEALKQAQLLLIRLSA